MPSARRDWNRDLKLGVVFGLACATIFTVMAAAGYAIGGPESFQRTLGISLNELVRIYWLCGLVGGIIVGLLRPLRTSPWGSFVLGFLAGLPMAFAIEIATTPRGEWASDLLFVVLAGVFEGGGLAVFLWYRTEAWSK